MPILENVVFMYAKIQTPGLKYQSETDKEYVVDVVVSKEQAKAWNKQFKKQPYRVIENEDFEGIFKAEVPFPDQDEQYVIKLKRDTHYKDGNPIDERARPKVYETNSKGKLVDITATKLVGNGSIGAVSYTESSNDFGTFAHLKAIRVDDLVEYESNYINELGEEDNGSDDSGLEPAPKVPVKPVRAAKPAKQEEPEPEAPAKPSKPLAKKPIAQQKEDEEKPVAKPRGRPAKAASKPVEDDSDDDNAPF